jgi:hypothetical protein
MQLFLTAQLQLVSVVAARCATLRHSCRIITIRHTLVDMFHKQEVQYLLENTKKKKKNGNIRQLASKKLLHSFTRLRITSKSMSVRLSARMEQLGSHCMDFNEILHLSIF